MIREAQELVAHIVPRTEIVITNDVGEYGNIHPAKKQEVGIRLANIALKENYGVLDQEVRSPFLTQVEIEKNQMILTFNHADEGLICKDKTVKGVQIAGEDGIFVEAKEKIEENRLKVYASGIKHPVAIRYCFDDATVGNLFNKQGLPVAPFEKRIKN